MGIKNILWISFEDTSPRFGCYGDAIAKTPNVDALASKGQLYKNATCTAAICAPSRFSIITGVYPNSAGAHHMRTSTVSPTCDKLPGPYYTCPPAYVKGFPEYLRAQGYFCSNNSKTDYQFGKPSSIWDKCAQCITHEDQILRCHWRDRHDPDQPFFAVFNLGYTHESGQWPSAKGRVPAVTDPADVEVPPYLPDTPVTRQALAQQYDHIAYNDELVGKILTQLEEDELAEETAVFIWSDHGEGLPRKKSWPYFSGLNIPLIAYVPGLTETGKTFAQPVSLIDLGPTMLSLLNLPIPTHMQGQAFLGNASEPARAYSFGVADRVGESYGMMRTVINERFTYAKNLYAYKDRNPLQVYRHKHPVYAEMDQAEINGTLTEPQRWLYAQQAPEELYDRENDPHEINNLAQDPAYREQLITMRKVLTDWQRDIGDMGDIDEQSMLNMWRTGETILEDVESEGFELGQTAIPHAVPLGPEHNGQSAAKSGDQIHAASPILLVLQSQTQGASVEYRINDGPWLLYANTLKLEPGSFTVEARAIRYGFAHSPMASFKVTIES